MAGFNKVIAIGNLGKDAEMRYSSNGKPVVNFSVATTYGSGEKEETEWLRCVWFGDVAEKVAQYLVKGKQIYIEGRLRTRSWQSDDGQKHYQTEVVLNQVQLLGSREGGSQQGGGQRRAGSPDPDDLPWE